MYGAGCLAFTPDESIGEVFARVLERAVANPGVYNVGELARSLSYMKQDSMGRGTIYYFPGVTFDSEGPQPDITIDSLEGFCYSFMNGGSNVHIDY